MPRKTRKTKTTSPGGRRNPEIFDTWYYQHFGNHALFDPRYKLYRNIYDLGGDHEYVDYLCEILKFGDHSIQYVRVASQALKSNEASTAKADKSKATSDIVSFIESPLARLFGSIVVLETAAEVEKIHPGINLELDVEMIGRIVGNARLEAATYELSQLKKNLKHYEESFESQRLLLNGLSKKEPIGKVLMEYSLNPELRPQKRGKKPDHWGSFFMLALTEYFRKKSDKAHYLEVRRLLNNLRGQRNKSSRADRTSAQTRVSQLKRSHPDWPSHLQLVTKYFYRVVRPRLSHQAHTSDAQ